MILILEPNTRPESVDYRMLTAQLERLSNVAYRVHREIGTEVAGNPQPMAHALPEDVLKPSRRLNTGAEDN